jgi:hypothetical protein
MQVIKVQGFKNCHVYFFTSIRNVPNKSFPLCSYRQRNSPKWEENIDFLTPKLGIFNFACRQCQWLSILFVWSPSSFTYSFEWFTHLCTYIHACQLRFIYMLSSSLRQWLCPQLCASGLLASGLLLQQSWISCNNISNAGCSQKSIFSPATLINYNLSNTNVRLWGTSQRYTVILNHAYNKCASNVFPLLSIR